MNSQKTLNLKIKSMNKHRGLRSLFDPQTSLTAQPGRILLIRHCNLMTLAETSIEFKIENSNTNTAITASRLRSGDDGKNKLNPQIYLNQANL
jgi:hypothetical protein